MINKKIMFFCLLAYLFQFIIETLAISSNSFFIYYIGADKLPKALIISSLLTPVVVFILSLLEVGKNSRQFKLILLIIISIMSLLFLYYLSGMVKYGKLSVWSYQIFSNLFSLVSIIVYWNLINNYFYVFESKLYFSYFIIAEEIGAITSDVLINQYMFDFSMTKYFYFVLFTLILSLILSCFIFQIKRINESDSNKEVIEKKYDDNSMIINSKNKNLFILVSIYILIICLFHFISSIVSYQFNYASGVKFTRSEDLNKFFSEFQFYSSLFIILSSFLLNKFLFSKSKIIIQHLIYALALLFLFYIMNIKYVFYTIVFAEMVKTILEHSLFQTSYEHFTSAFNEKISDKIRNFSEGFFIPIIIVLSGIFMTFFPSKFSIYYLNISLIVVVLLIILCIFFIKNYYYKYHMKSLENNFTVDNMRSIQALGEKNNYPSIKFLTTNYTITNDRYIKKNIILSIGKISSSQSIDYIFNILNEEDEFLQSAAVDALFMYNSYKVHYLLVEFIQGKKNKSFYVRHKVISYINKIYKNAIIPFFMHLLYSDDHRIVANAIENFWDIKDKNIIPFMTSFLHHPSNRVRANAIILIYNFDMNYYNEICLRSLNLLKKSKDMNDNLSFVFVVGFLKMNKYSDDVIDIYEKLKNIEIFKDKLVENFAFSFSGLNNPIGDDLFQFLFMDLKNYPNTLLYKFKLLSLFNRIKIIKNFFAGEYGYDTYNNFYENFKHSIYDLSFELEIIEELMPEKK
ncbi:HEAT repeat domain-containing protein [Silvanigrella aquatica]|uniref:ADP,ATP carrier protein n=1 Tax=Silvanigrella aquatica TaxID=1915309 RepID=A0A1L4CZB3_9BACT|nr:HEAT repeat domain-containing protein [Silvanigrella aquatica]APJ03303.1 hypothetical protein AXG55_05050 [Silvanigrella aquatica]